MNLQAWLKQPHLLAEQLRVMEGVSAALNELHERGVVHGDLSPLTVEVGPDGMGSLGSPDMSGSLGLGAGRSSGPYIAPEVVQNSPASPKADIYAAGVLFYEMLTGVVPIPGQAAPLRDKRGDVPRDLADAVTACLETDPNWRPKDLAYLLELVRKLRGSDAAVAAPRPAAARGPEPRTASTGATPKAKTPPAPPKASGGGLPLAPIAVVVALALGGGVWFWMKSNPPAPTPTPVAQTEPVATTAPAVTAPPTTAPEVTEKPTPKPKASGASPEATPTPAATPTPKPTATPVATPPPAITEPAATRPTPAATAVPVATPTPPPVTVGPPALKTVAPPSMKGPGTTILDVRGVGLHPSHQARLLKSGKPAAGVTVVRQRFVNEGLVQVVVKVEDASTGTYGLVMLDSEGRTSNLVPFQITR